MITSITITHFLAFSTIAWAWPTDNQPCVYPNSCWPSDDDWNSLNHTLGGSLFRSRPPAYVCHVPFLNEAACNIAKTNWTNQFWRAEQPGGYFDLAWENGDSYCNIDNDPNIPCDQGLVPIYVAKVKDVTDVQNAVHFARDHKISTRVKGASHDFLGRSSGNGTFGISTIRLKGITFEDDFKPQGAPSDGVGQSAVHLGAGEQWYYVSKAADEKGVVVVGGASYSVGAAGGWVLGGGHGSLSPQYGLGVDNVLEFEIVTPAGNVRIVNQYQDQDLFWALRGGGAGFGVVTKVTYKTYPAIQQIVEMLPSINYTEASYPNFLKIWFGIQSTLRAQNFSGYSFPSPTNFWAQLLVHNSGDMAAANATLQPLYDFVQQEKAAGRSADISNDVQVLPNYFSLFPTPIDQLNEGAGNFEILGSRLLPLSMFEGDAADALVEVIANSTSVQFLHIAGGKVSEVAPDATAVHPSWRQATHHVFFLSVWETNTSFSERAAIRRDLTEQTQRLARLVPEAGAYLNEADINEPQWSQIFWGSNYDRLVSIKNTIDPFGIFTCYHCVGYNDS